MKKLNIMLVGITMSLIVSCSFKGKYDGQQVLTSTTLEELKIDPHGDSDGDGLNDQREIELGKNPFVANLPDLKIRFLQNYSIQITYHEKDSTESKVYIIDTKITSTDPESKYRVGKVFARTNALKTAASFGRFSSHNSGKIEERDYSWVSYPELDPKFFNGKALEFRDILEKGAEIENVKIILTNQARLVESSLFHEVNNLNLNFYYYNNETENYEILSSQTIERHFQSGVFETFDVVIENAPIELITESLFKHGQFIISEVSNYNITERGIDYKTLIGTVRAKTVPVLLETPLEEKISYVATQQEGISFNGLLNLVFDNNFKVENDQLIKINQFENNLGAFTNLKEVKDKDKLGKWFVMTNELRKSYLDHKFNNRDRVVLAYITGTELAEQANESTYAYRHEVNSNHGEIIIPLGNVSVNSKIDFQLKPLFRFGREIQKTVESFNRVGGSCGRNCVQLPISCSWEVNIFKDYKDEFKFQPDFSGEGEKIDLLINGDSFSLTQLLKEKKVKLFQTSVGTHFTINDISLIKELKGFEENFIALKLRSFSGTDFFGVKLIDMGGNWRGVGGCPFSTPAVAEKYQTQVSKDTKELGEISWLINDLANRGYGYKFNLMDSGPYYQEVTFDVSSTIQNYFN